MLAAEKLEEAIGHAIPAKRRGKCALCWRSLHPGEFDLIAKVPDYGWSHLDCAIRWLRAGRADYEMQEIA